VRVCITGGSGSLGRTILARLAREGADRIVTFSRDEQKRLALQAEFAWHPGVKVYAGDVRDAGRLPDILYGCDLVVHAAARKVVSGHPDEPREMLRTNVEGTQNVIAAARDAGVRKLLFVSSDKAVAPVNCYGVSKAMAEHLVISENARSWARGLRLGVIRYGNVLASNGSVVRVWRECLARGEPMPVSDARMTRFWLTLDQAACYVMKAAMDLRGGEVFVPALKAAPLRKLAEALDPNAMMVDIGIRPGGEKLHEELLSSDEVRRTVKRNGFYIVTPTQTADSWDASPWLGEPVPEDFRYQSDTWPEQWTVEELRELLQ
jgi:UDP-N-acetylglucosamine 4,6-dehydratase